MGRAADRLAFREHVLEPPHELHFITVFLSAGLGHLLGLVQPLLDGVEIGKHELRLDHLDVRLGIHLVRHVDHVRVFEAAHHVRDGVHLADVGQELVPQPLALGSALHQPGDVHELHARGRHFLRLVDLGELVETLVRHVHHAHVRIDGGEGIVRGLRAGRGERVEDGGLADVRQADDTAVKTHDITPCENKLPNPTHQIPR